MKLETCSETGSPIIDGTRVQRLLAGGDSNTKLRKNGPAVISAGLSLSSEKTSGAGNVCPHASSGCAAACLDHQGRANIWPTIRAARVARTKLWFSARPLFLEMLRADIRRFERKALKESKRVAMRLNVFSDIQWERTGIIEEFPDVQFYDYTKNPKRVPMKLPNYSTTFSLSESNKAEALNILRSNGNVAVPFADMSGNYVGNRSGLQRLPKTWNGFRVIDGDVSDLRYEDPTGRTRGLVVGLRLKAHSTAERVAAIASGFAVKVGR